VTQPNPPSGATPSGSTVPLTWQASADYQFAFVLSYAANGSFEAVTCSISSRQASFSGNPYALPLQLVQKDNAGQEVDISMKLAPAGAPYAGSVWCNISVPGFIFQGVAFQFSAAISGPPPVTVW
jgi:hypothetical protein